MDKAPDAFRTISEVAEELDLPQHVLRFWETRFSQIRPLKRGGGRRYYRPDDVDLLRGIRHLLYGQGFTIKGVQRILKEQGVRAVMEVWRTPGGTLPATVSPGAPDEEIAPMPPRASADPRDPRFTVPQHEPDDDAEDAPRAAAPWAPDPAYEPQRPPVQRPAVTSDFVGPLFESGRPQLPALDEPLPAGILPDDTPAKTGFRFMERLRGGEAQAGSGSLSRDDIRRLQSTLFELLECKRVLDQTR